MPAAYAVIIRDKTRNAAQLLEVPTLGTCSVREILDSFARGRARCLHYRQKAFHHMNQWSANRVRGYLFPGLVVLLFSIQVCASEQTAPNIRKLVVAAVDGKYLYRQSPAWRSARESMLAIDSDEPRQTYAAVARQLSTLADSELHLVSPSELSAIDGESKGTTVGIGLIDFAIDLEPDTGEARVVTPVVGSPAASAGIRPRDVIVSVNGEPTRTMGHEEVLDALRERSPAGTSLRIRRGAKNFDIEITPDLSPLKSVVFDLKPMGVGVVVGYIRIVQFTPDAGALVREAVTSLEDKHAGAYILDLRNNPGGFLDSATAVVSVFTSSELGFKVRADGATEPIHWAGPVLTRKPLAVLINEGTASAAEFCAAVLLDDHRGALVGSPSYGRGQVQIYVPLTLGYGLIVPSALLRTSGGRLFKGKGLDPDFGVLQQSLPASDLATPRDRQYQEALSAIHSRR
jgi:carboxyl-terminal processing protease